MYSRCPSCTALLGENRLLESFPVGRRLAYDPGKGRLWVLCPGCRSWNLAPIEERWEAVEDAERLFGEADAGASSENLALARHREGTQLIRVGPAPVRELAGWRYGQRLLGRWRRHRRETVLSTGIVLGLGSIPVIGNLALPILLGLIGTDLAVRHHRGNRPAGSVHGEGEGSGRILRVRDLRAARLIPEGDRGWALEVPGRGEQTSTLQGPTALSALRASLPSMNHKGGKPGQVNHAVDRVLELGEPDRVLAASARDLTGDWRPAGEGLLPDPHALPRLDPTRRLTLEIAANEEVERRALEGELRTLEREWEDAEELAAISDDLLFPYELRRRLEAMKERARG